MNGRGGLVMQCGRWLCLLTLATYTVLAGCSAAKPSTATTRPAFRADTLKLDELLAAINKNNEALPSLRVLQYYEALIPDDRGTERFVNGNGTIMFRQPKAPGQGADFRLIGRKDVAGVVFDLGTRGDRFWLSIAVDVNTTWIGSTGVAERNYPSLPLRPDLLLHVLGTATHNTDLLSTPAPVLRYNPDADAYMLLWVRQDNDRVIAEREIWYDRETLHPTLVLLFDRNGRVVLRAYLSEHIPVPKRGVDVRDQPRIASRYQIFFPANKAKMFLKLRDPKVKFRGIPNDFSFAFKPPVGAKVIDLDRRR